MITYIILHYNRPYLLDLNIQFVRKYFPKDTLIMLVDDGSSKSVIDSVKDKADLVYSGENHTDYSCCKVFSSAISWLGKQALNIDYIVFSEDDFLFWPSPITISVEQSKGEGLLDPSVDIVLPELVRKGDPVKSSISLLQNCKGIHVVQPSRQIKNVHYQGNAGIPQWRILDHQKITKYYYNNWPFMMRSSEFFEIEIPASGSIATLEGSNCKWFDRRFGKTNYVAIPERPYYFHVGYSFSLQPANERNSRRIKAFQDLQKLTGSNLEPPELNQVLCSAYLRGDLRFSITDIKEKDLQKVFLENVGKIHG